MKPFFLDFESNKAGQFYLAGSEAKGVFEQRVLTNDLRGFAEAKSLLMQSSEDFVSVNPSYACENMKSGTKVDACNTGIYFQIGKKSDEKGITGKFYFSYENLNSGPKHEYGLQFKSDF